MQRKSHRVICIGASSVEAIRDFIRNCASGSGSIPFRQTFLSPRCPNGIRNSSMKSAISVQRHCFLYYLRKATPKPGDTFGCTKSRKSAPNPTQHKLLATWRRKLAVRANVLLAQTQESSLHCLAIAPHDFMHRVEQGQLEINPYRSLTVANG